MERFDDTFRELLDSQTLFFPCVGEVVSASGAYINVRPVITYEGTAAPVLKQVPVLLILGSGWKVDFSLSAGDKVLLVFGCHPIPMWTTDDKNELEMVKPELHHAIAIPIQISGGMKVSNAAGDVLTVSDTGVIAGNGGDFVALAQRVEAKIDAISNAISGAATGSADGGAAFKANIVSALAAALPAIGSVASSNMKADY